MSRRSVRLLLVLLVLVNQGLCLALAQRGIECVGPEGHGWRPHIHVGGHGREASSRHRDRHSICAHHGHSIDPGGDLDHGLIPSAFSRCPAVTPHGDHDSDAIYCSGPVTVARDGNSAGVRPAKDFAFGSIFHEADPGDVLLPQGGRPPCVFEAACPIYLRTHSLRI